MATAIPTARSNLDNALLTFDRITTSVNGSIFMIEIYCLRIDMSSNGVQFSKFTLSSNKTIAAATDYTDQKPGIYDFRMSYDVLRW